MSEPPQGNGSRKALGWVFKVVMSIALLTWLFSKPSTRETLAGVNASTVQALALAVVVYLGCMALNALKWWLLLGASGWPVRFGECLRITLIGMFANFFLPTSIGGDVLRIGLISRSGVPASVGALTVFLQRFTGLIAMLLIGLVGMVIASGTGTAAQQEVLYTSAVVTIVLLAGLGLAWYAEQRWTVSERLPAALGRPVKKIGTALGALGQAKLALAQVMAVSIVFQLLMVLLQGWLGWAVGVRPGALEWLWVVPMMGLGEMIPVGLAGIGPRDAMLVFLLGDRFAGCAVATLLWHAMKLFSSLPGGVLMMLSPKESRAAVDKTAA